MQHHQLILLIYDHSESMPVLDKILSESYPVKTVGYDADIFGWIAKFRPSLIFLDTTMPSMRACELCALLKADPNTLEIPVILICDNDDVESDARALVAGANDFIHIPLKQSVVLVRVKLHLNLERQKKALQLAENRLSENQFDFENSVSAKMGELAVINQRLEDRVAERTEQLVLSEIRTRAFMNTALDAVVVVDMENRIVEFNPAAEEMFGYPTQEIIGKGVDMLMPQHLGASNEGYFGMLRNHINSRSANTTVELLGLKKSGLTFPIEVTLGDIGASNFKFYVGIIRDITYRREVEMQLETARRRELDIGSAIQKNLLFGQPPVNLNGFSVSCFSEAYEGVAGDFYTFTRLNANSFEILTGDVMGKGIPAALIAAGLEGFYRRTFLELMAERQGIDMPSPAEIMNAIHDGITPHLIGLETFVTLSLLRFDRIAQTVTWVNAGHTPTLLARHAEHDVAELFGDNLPLGVDVDERYRQHVTDLGTRDTVLLYSDGVSEYNNSENEQYGSGRIVNILERGAKGNYPPAIILQSLRADVRMFADFKPGSDDKTGVLVQLHPLRGAIRGKIIDRKAPRYLVLSQEMDRLALVRRRISQLAVDQTEDFIQSLTLASVEVVTNIIRHSPSKYKDIPITISLERNIGIAGFRLEFFYGGAQFMRDSHVDEPDFSGESTGGFGLFIIENCVDKVTYGSPMPGIASIALYKEGSVNGEMD